MTGSNCGTVLFLKVTAIHAKVEVSPAANALNIGRRLGKTVEYTWRHGAIQVVDDIKDIVKRLSAMHDERHAQFMAPVQLNVEGVLLLLAPSLVPIKVDADFTNGHDGILVEHGTHLAQNLKIVIVDILGMQAQCHRDIIGILLLHGGKARYTLQILVRQHDVPHSSFSRPSNYRITVLVECVTINMRMTVNHNLFFRQLGQLF